MPMPRWCRRRPSPIGCRCSAAATASTSIISVVATPAATQSSSFARRWAPLVDAGNGGSVTAYPATLAGAVAGIKDVETIITGHSTTPIGREGTYRPFNPTQKWSDLQEYTEFAREFVSAVQAAKASGKSVDEALSALRLPDKYRDYDMTNARADIARAYEELK